jgi:hypothetical protein
VKNALSSLESSIDNTISEKKNYVLNPGNCSGTSLGGWIFPVAYKQPSDPFADHFCCDLARHALDYRKQKVGTHVSRTCTFACGRLACRVAGFARGAVAHQGTSNPRRYLAGFAPGPRTPNNSTVTA